MLAEADDNHSRANKGEHSGKEHLAKLQEKDAPNLNNLVEKGRHAEIFVGGLLIDLEGRIVGMNFIDENRTPFLPVQIVGRCLKHFRNLAFVLQDTSFLYMGRLLEGFGVGVISYTVNRWTVAAPC
ncbi:uncharacterized protein LOC119285563 isoform X4 [Triticum dicoccoides]|nr:uncharacterized protein LOC119285563 isoform X4 [Triticum dicoccoides]XP_044340253.1 uncharacterized protein LOC123061265 isoform X4 [Triticum aestivum]